MRHHDRDESGLESNGVPYECDCEGVACRELLSSGSVCRGDSDGDGSINPSDVGLVKFWYGGVSIESPCRYDVSCDGSTKPADVGIANSHYWERAAESLPPGYS